MIDGQFTPAYQFVRNSDSKTSGVVTQTSQVAVILPFTTNATDSAGNTPVSVTASALATVTGVWSAVDDDDIMLSFDMNTLKIDVDPDAEYLYADPRLSTDIPRVQPIDGNVRSAVTALVKKGMTDVVGNIREIEDVKVKDGMMRCEIGKHNKLTFSSGSILPFTRYKSPPCSGDNLSKSSSSRISFADIQPFCLAIAYPFIRLW